MVTRLRCLKLMAVIFGTVLGVAPVAPAAAEIAGEAQGAKPAVECNSHREDDLASFDIVSAKKAGGALTVEFLLTLRANVAYKTNPYNWADCPTTGTDSNGYVWELASTEPNGTTELRPGMKLRGKLKFRRATGDVSADSFALTICRGFGPAEGPWSYENVTYRFDAVPADCQTH